MKYETEKLKYIIMERDYDLTEKQIIAIKNVEKAMKKAFKCGVGFWDNYCTMSAYNTTKICQPTPDSSFEEKLDTSAIYNLKVPNFGGGNADDTLYINRCE